MKNTMIFKCLLASLSLTAVSHAVVLEAGGGAISAGNNYTVTNVTAQGTNGLGSAVNSGNTAVFTFAQAVDLTITNNDNSSTVIFDHLRVGTVDSNTFTADSGAWTFTPGTSTTVPAFTNSGSTFAFGSLAAGFANPTQDWGSLTISGITELTWITADESNFESFSFSAVDVIPEPTSAALLGLGGLALLGRRKRA